MKHKRIILIEDDINLCQSIKLILQRAGHHVVATHSISKALQVIESGEYKLVIADINIPEVRSCLIPVMLSQPKLSILFLTDQPAAEIDMDNQLHSVHYLYKPVAPEQMLDFIQMTLGASGHSSSKKQLMYL